MFVSKVLKPLRVIVVFSLVMFLICGLLYPLALTGLSQLIFPWQANGSLIYIDDKPVGSALIGQNLQDPRFMKGRPSAVNYNVYTAEELADGTYGGVATGSNNYANSNPDLKARVEADIETFLAANPTVKKGEIPGDILTASGSGLDPHITPISAEIQVPALAENSGLSEEKLREIIAKNTTGKGFGVFGEDTVNVLLVNLDIAKELGLI